MGYEIVFHYKDATDRPGVYEDEIKTRNCKVGKITEEIELDAIAGKIMSQLARRNILIVDVEIYEYAKKKLGYRETSDGIVIKNKKFSFDSGRVIVTEEFESEDDFKPVPSPSKELADRSCPVVRNQKSQNLARRAIRQEVYDPDPIGQQKVRQKGLKFTLGKKYPVYSEESLGSTLVYNTTDDSGKDVKVSAEYFVAVGSGLIEADEGPKYVGAETQKEEINLWGNYEQVDMPDIRRR
jgi:hypothetical protein